MIISTDSADAAGDEVRISRIFPSHENAVATKDRRRAVTLDNFAIVEVDLGEDPQTSNNPSDGIPVHLDEISGLGSLLLLVELRTAQRDRSFRDTNLSGFN